MKEINDKDWISVLKDRLESYTPDVPQMDFGEIEKKMLAASAARKMAARSRRLNVLKYAAAVAVIAAAGLLLLPRSGDKTAGTDAPVAQVSTRQADGQADGASALPQAVQQPPQDADLLAEATQKASKAQKSNDNTSIPTQPTPSFLAPEKDSSPETLLADDEAGADSKEAEPAAETATAAVSGSVTVVNPGRVNIQKPVRKSSGSKFALGASGLLAADMSGRRQGAAPGGMMMYTDRDGNVFMSMGAPLTEYHYSAPVSGGISLRYNFAGPFWAESGLRFTYLHTWATPSGAIQDLLFAGIPVGLGVNLLQYPHLSLYSSVFGMPSKCIMGRESASFPSNYTKLSEIPIMWSAGASVGASYNFSKLLSIFAEPTVSYYFTDARAPQTMFKENPIYFTLNLGVRFNLE